MAYMLSMNAICKPLKIVTWASGTDEEIVAMVQAADEGKIDLSDYWAVGDERTVHLSAMAATGVGESHVEQDVTFVLLNQGGKTLASGTECSFIVGLKNCLSEQGYMNSSNSNSGSWEGSARRAWCNSVFKNAIPSTLLPIFKQHINKTASAYDSDELTESTDWFALAAAKEVLNAQSYGTVAEAAALTQFTYYATAANRIKKLGNDGAADSWWERSPSDVNNAGFCRISESGGSSVALASKTYGISPFGCI